MNKTLQNDVIITNAEIANFRGIKNCIVEDLSLVNFFVGTNNSGKSTLLDAMYLACKEPFKASLSDIFEGRTGRREVGAYELFYGYNKRSIAKLSLEYKNGTKYSVSLFLAKEDIGDKGTTVNEGNLAVYFEHEDEELYITQYNNTLNKLNELDHIPPSIEDIRNYNLYVTLFPSNINKKELTTILDTNLSKIKINPELEVKLTDIMNDVYHEFDYEFIPNPEDIKDRRVAFTNGSNRIYSDFHGDGTQRTLAFLSNLKLYNNTAVFIEEIEMFQHPTAIRKLAKYMVEIAKKNNIQLFISTHSYYDALRFFYYAFEDEKERNDLFRNYVVNKNNGDIEVNKENNVQNIINELYDSTN